MPANTPLVTELVPFDPTIGITVVASVTLVLMVAVMVFFALAPTAVAE